MAGSHRTQQQKGFKPLCSISIMTFYVKHLRALMQRAGAEYTPQNKDLLDRAVREVLNMERADAPEVWEKVREIMFSGKDEGKKKGFEDAVVKLMVKYLIMG